MKQHIVGIICLGVLAAGCAKTPLQPEDKPCDSDNPSFQYDGMTPYVKYNMFHKEMKRKFLKNPFHQANMFYNQEQDFYVCPMGQHMEHVTDKKTVSDLGYVSHTSVYKAVD